MRIRSFTVPSEAAVISMLERFGFQQPNKRWTEGWQTGKVVDADGMVPLVLMEYGRVVRRMGHLDCLPCEQEQPGLLSGDPHYTEVRGLLPVLAFEATVPHVYGKPSGRFRGAAPSGDPFMLIGGIVSFDRETRSAKSLRPLFLDAGPAMGYFDRYEPALIPLDRVHDWLKPPQMIAPVLRQAGARDIQGRFL